MWRDSSAGLAMAESFGGLLRGFRLAAGLSQEDLAERAGLSPAAVGALERGDRRHPYPHTVSILATALALTHDQRTRLLDSVPRRGSYRGGTDVRGEGYAPLPVPLTPLVGRTNEIGFVTGHLTGGGARWVTLTGAGGVGKTRLAIAVASAMQDTFRDGAVWVDLAQTKAHDVVVPTIARALGLAEDAGGHTEANLMRHLRNRNLLLVLDNLEQIVDSVPLIVGLIEQAPAVAALATSRTALRIRGEHEWQVAPLALPDPSSPGISTEAPELFLQRARAVLPDLDAADHAEDVVAICRRLDGMPLALELAAAQLRYTTIRELRVRLDEQLPLTVGGLQDLPPRQRSIRASMEWSHDLLSERDREVFARASVFEGGFTLPAAEAACADPRQSAADISTAVTSLLDASMLTVARVPGLPTRFGMLDTLRTFAAERLAAAGEESRVAGRHAAFYATLAGDAASHLPSGDRGPWLARLESEAGNLTAALSWAQASGDVETTLRMVSALGWYWVMSGRLIEGRRWVDSADRADLSAYDADLAAGVKYSTAALAWKTNDLTRSRALIDESVALAREGDWRSLALALSLSGLIWVSQSKPDLALAPLQESLSLFAGANDTWGIAYARANLGDAMVRTGDSEGAGVHYREGLHGFREVGDPWGQAIVLHMLGSLAFESADFKLAREHYTESVEHCRRIGNRENLARGLVGLAATLLQLGEVDRAEDCLLESIDALECVGLSGAGLPHRGLAAVCAARGDFQQAADLFDEAEAAGSEGSLFMVDATLFDTQRRMTKVALGR